MIETIFWNLIDKLVGLILGILWVIDWFKNLGKNKK